MHSTQLRAKISRVWVRKMQQNARKGKGNVEDPTTKYARSEACSMQSKWVLRCNPSNDDNMCMVYAFAQFCAFVRFQASFYSLVVNVFFHFSLLARFSPLPKCITNFFDVAFAFVARVTHTSTNTHTHDAMATAFTSTTLTMTMATTKCETL